MTIDFQKKKPARTPDILLSKLIEKKLTINESDYLEIKNKIRNIGYFRLSGYFGPLESSKDIFREGATFQDIIRLYDFDQNLRLLISKALKSIEIGLKTKLTDTMSLTYESDWYVNRELFMTEKSKPEFITRYTCQNGEVTSSIEKVETSMYNSLIKEIQHQIVRNKETEYIKKFKIKYGDSAIVPSWMMMECISFGALSRLFLLLKYSPEKKAISTHFGTVSPDILSSWLHGFVVLRNLCAHHARVWNKKLNKDLTFPKKSSAKFITASNEDNLRKFYGISGCLLQSLSKISTELSSDFKNEFNELVISHGIDKNAMGFPNELESYDIWNETL